VRCQDVAGIRTVTALAHAGRRRRPGSVDGGERPYAGPVSGRRVLGQESWPGLPGNETVTLDARRARRAHPAGRSGPLVRLRYRAWAARHPGRHPGTGIAWTTCVRSTATRQPPSTPAITRRSTAPCSLPAAYLPAQRRPDGQQERGRYHSRAGQHHPGRPAV